MQKLKGLWIPAEILLNKDLSDKKIILTKLLGAINDDSVGLLVL